MVRLSEYKKSLLSEGTELTLVDFFLVLTGKEPCVTNMDGRARLDIISVVKDSYHELLKDFSQKNTKRGDDSEREEDMRSAGIEDD